jgi:hypothetical protein
LGAEREREQQAVPDLPAADLKCAQEEGSSAMNEWIYIYTSFFDSFWRRHLSAFKEAAASQLEFHRVSFHSSQGGSLI